jgi:transketolase
MIIAKTIKGKGVSFVEDKNGFHGKALDKEQLEKALQELGEVDKSFRGEMAKPEDLRPQGHAGHLPEASGAHSYSNDKAVATRKAYGQALVRIFPKFPGMVALDGEVSNSTYSEIFEEKHPDRFFEMYICEQNMTGMALGLHTRGKLPFVSTFAAFFTRAFDQIRMSQYSDANIKFCGSHAGVSIGEDGASQMGLEDIAMFRSIAGSVVLYPCDAISTEKLVEAAAEHKGMVYIRTTRKDTPILYSWDDAFPIGGNKVLRYSDNDAVAVIAAGVTLWESLAACDELEKEGIRVRVIDLYCIKPIDEKALRDAIGPAKAIVTVEDHHEEGGIGEAVRSALSVHCLPVHALAVRKIPRSGKPGELLDFEEISRNAVAKKIKELL